MYNHQQLHALIVKCENGYGVDVCYEEEGVQKQKTYVALTVSEAIQMVNKFFTEGKIDE